MLAPGFLTHSGPSRVEPDVAALLTRMRGRFYPETIPVLASFWLKTVVARGYGLRQWKQIDRLLNKALSDQRLTEFARRGIIDIRSWIERAILLTGQAPHRPSGQSDGARVTLSSERLAPYAARLLNQWLPIELARMLVKENVFPFAEGDAVPVLAIGSALEALLVRERLAPSAVEALLQPDLLSPHDIYPADAEMLQDVALSLLGRTSAPPPSVMPAALLCIPADSPLPPNFREAVHRAFFVRRPDTEEVHVPIGPAKVLEILRAQPVRIASVIVTRDGRWWESDKLQSGTQHTVVYRAVGRLRLDYSADHLRLRVPWPEARTSWPGSVHFPASFEIFGREWRVSSWEKNAEGAWLHLVFSRILPLAESVPEATAGAQRLHPASVDMAWAALGNALAEAMAQRNGEPIEALRHADLIPLGRALFALTTSLLSRRPQPYVVVESQAAAVRYWESQISAAYGSVPWRILPGAVCAALLRCRSYPRLVEQLSPVFDSLPDKLTARRQEALARLARFRIRRLPPRAA